MDVGESLNEDGNRRTLLVGAGEALRLEELGRLVETLGLEVVGSLSQGRRDGAGYLGRGKRVELAELVTERRAGFVVTDDELTASQARVLERDSGTSVVDRTELIIRIFEAHARDRESRLEVEMADLAYRLPRVKGRNDALSRLGGSVGGGRIARGPGEQQLEYDRRAIRERMEKITARLKQARASRGVRGAKRREGGPPSVALVGYTNSGKTTMLNALSGAGRSTADRLFETLETTTRLVESSAGGSDGSESRPDFVVTDTVGFISKLPTQLVRSFESTLEEARDADVQVLCADASSPDLEGEINTVNATLQKDWGGARNRDSVNGVGENSGPHILCLNKVDLISSSRLEELMAVYPDAVSVSAISGDLDPLLNAIHAAISHTRMRMEILIPHSEYGVASKLYGSAEIHASRDTNQGAWLDVTLPRSIIGKYSRYRVSRESLNDS